MSSEEELTERRRNELELIRSMHGGMLNPVDVVEFSKNKKTALHSAFTCDDTEAAEAHRLWQARQVIRVCVRVVGDEQKGPPIRTYVSLYDDRGQDGYRLLDDVLADDELCEKLLTQALCELRTWQTKYQQLKKLAPVFAAADAVESKTKSGGAGNGSRTIRIAAQKA